MQLTPALFTKMRDTSKVISSYAVPMIVDNKTKAVWSNPDEQYNIELNLKTNVISGEWYDWNETSEDWETTREMTQFEIIEIIGKNLIKAV